MHRGGLIDLDDHWDRHRSIAIGQGNNSILAGWKEHFFRSLDGSAVIVVDGLQPCAIRSK